MILGPRTHAKRSFPQGGVFHPKLSLACLPQGCSGGQRAQLLKAAIKELRRPTLLGEGCVARPTDKFDSVLCLSMCYGQIKHVPCPSL